MLVYKIPNSSNCLGSICYFVNFYDKKIMKKTVKINIFWKYKLQIE